MRNEFLKADKSNKKGVFFIKGTIIGVATTLILMLICAAAILIFNIDRAYAAPFATICLAAGSFAASFYSAKKIGDRGYIWGALIGGAVFVIITVLSLIINRSGLTSNTAFHFVIIMLASIVGGIIGVNKGKNKKYI